MKGYRSLIQKVGGGSSQTMKREQRARPIPTVSTTTTMKRRRVLFHYVDRNRANVYTRYIHAGNRGNRSSSVRALPPQTTPSFKNKSTNQKSSHTRCSAQLYCTQILNLIKIRQRVWRQLQHKRVDTPVI